MAKTDDYYTPKIGGHRQQWISHKMSIQQKDPSICNNIISKVPPRVHVMFYSPDIF